MLRFHLSPRSRVLWLGLLAVALAMLATSSSAQRSLECERVWKTPSSDNGILDCIISLPRIGSQWRYYLLTGFIVLFLIVFILAVPLMWCNLSCGCCICCECCVPTKLSDRSKARCWLWMWIMFVIIWSCGVCVMVIYGADILMKTANKTLDDVQSGPIEYLENSERQITSLLTDYSTNPPTPPPVDLSAFTSVMDSVGSLLRTVRNDYFKYFKIAAIVSYCVGAASVALILLVLLCACCRCVGCFPKLLTSLYYMLGIIFGILAIVFSVVLYATTAGCGEVALHYKREPGIFQWYFVPWCDRQFDFNGMKNEIQSTELTVSRDGCAELLKYCGNNDVYDAQNKADEIFTCSITTANQCTSFSILSDVLLTSRAKSMLNNMLCTDTTGWSYQESCTPTQCITRCQDYTNPPIAAQTWARQVVRSAEAAMNASTALTYALPLLQCDFILDQVLTALDASGSGYMTPTDSNSNCANIRISAIMLTSGFFVGLIMFFLSIYILIRGQFVWTSDEAFSKKSSVQPVTGPEEHNPFLNQQGYTNTEPTMRHE